MSESMQKKTSGLIVTAFIGLIVISFMVGGIQTFTGTPDTVAQVGDEVIKIREYQNEFSRQLQLYSQFMGGKDLSSKQIESFGIKGRVLDGLISQKIMLHFAEDIGVFPGSTEITDKIKDLPYFKTNDQFDINKYKAILAQNSLSPSDFEKSIGSEVKMRKSYTILSSLPVSKGFEEDVKKLKEEKTTVNLYQFSKNAMTKFVTVSDNEIKDYLENKENLEKIQKIFNERKKNLDEPEQVKARHILLSTKGKNEDKVKNEIEKLAKEVNVKNFKKMANKYTEDPSGKQNGGDLRWFGRGMMVPEFDQVAFSMKPGTISKPLKTQFGYHIIYLEDKKKAKVAKFKDYQNKFTTEEIQKTKNKEREDLVKEVTAKLEKSLKAGNSKAASKIATEYEMRVMDQEEINLVDGTKGPISLKENQIQNLFNSQDTSFTFDDPLNVTFAMKVAPKKAKKDDASEKKDEDFSFIARKLEKELIENYKNKLTIRVNKDLIGMR